MKHILKSKRRFFFIIPVIILFAVSGVVMWLWNTLLPEIFYVNSITYWQAMGILVLSKILFGGFSGCARHRHFHRNRYFIEKMKNMTPEEQEKFKESWKQRFHKRECC